MARPCCVRCEEVAVVSEPFGLCRLHAIEFYTGVVAIGAATARVHQQAPGHVAVIDVHPAPQTAHAKAQAEVARVASVDQALRDLRDDLSRLQGAHEIRCRSCGEIFQVAEWSKWNRITKTLCQACRSASGRRGAQLRHRNQARRQFRRIDKGAAA
jgi:hypothetical protein